MCKGRPRGLVTWLSLSARILPQFHQPALEDFFDCVLWFNLWGEEKEGCSLTHTHPPLHLVPITPQRKRPLQCPTLPCTTEEHNWVSFSTELFHKSSLDGSQASHVHTENNLSIDMIYIEHLTDWQKQCSWERPFCINNSYISLQVKTFDLMTQQQFGIMMITQTVIKRCKMITLLTPPTKRHQIGVRWTGNNLKQHCFLKGIVHSLKNENVVTFSHSYGFKPVWSFCFFWNTKEDILKGT